MAEREEEAVTQTPDPETRSRGCAGAGQGQIGVGKWGEGDCCLVLSSTQVGQICQAGPGQPNNGV